MSVLLAENWRRVIAAAVAAVVMIGLGTAIGSVSSSSGSTPVRTVTATQTVTVQSRAASTQVTKLKGQLAASNAQVGSLQQTLRVTRQNNRKLRARLAGHNTTKKGK